MERARCEPRRRGCPASSFARLHNCFAAPILSAPFPTTQLTTHHGTRATQEHRTTAATAPGHGRNRSARVQARSTGAANRRRLVADFGWSCFARRGSIRTKGHVAAPTALHGSAVSGRRLRHLPTYSSHPSPPYTASPTNSSTNPLRSNQQKSLADGVCCAPPHGRGLPPASSGRGTCGSGSRQLCSGVTCAWSLQASPNVRGGQDLRCGGL